MASFVPSGRPRRLDRLPAAMLRTITSRGTMLTRLTSVSRSDSSSTKCVGTPSFSRSFIRWLVTRLLMAPLPAMVPFFRPLKAVASSL